MSIEPKRCAIAGCEKFVGARVSREIPERKSSLSIEVCLRHVGEGKRAVLPAAKVEYISPVESS